MLLLLSTGVARLAFLIQTTFVADAERAVVVVLGMSALDILGQNGKHLTIATDIVVVTGLTEAGIACGNEAFNSEGLVAAVT